MEVTDKEISSELAKNRADNIVAKQELEKEKLDFINKIQNGIGEEIKNLNQFSYNQKTKIKISFWQRTKNFFNKLLKILGG